MYRKIIVGYQRGEHGAEALALARTLASAGAVEDVLVIEVLSGRSDHPSPELAGATEGWPQGVRVSGRAEHGGSAADTLTAVAEREGAELLVLGSTHRGFAGRLLGGTTAGSVLPEAVCPVVVAPAGYAGSVGPLREIAVAYDSSDEARRALEWAASVASAMSAQLRLVGVVTPPPQVETWGASVPGEVWSTGLSYPQTVEIIDATREQMDRELAAAAAAAGCSVAGTATVVGDPGRELHAAAEDVDMLVVGSHGRGPLASVLLGSVSRGLAHSCPSPLAVVPGARRDD